ncbi:MAG: hypothetical protein AB1797_13490 [bacterium]
MRHILLGVVALLFIYPAIADGNPEISTCCQIKEEYSKEDLIEIIKAHREFFRDKVFHPPDEEEAAGFNTRLYGAVLYELGDDAYLEETKDYLLQQAADDRYVDSGQDTFSIFYIYDAAKRGQAYLAIKDIPGLFTEGEKEAIENWFARIYEAFQAVGCKYDQMIHSGNGAIFGQILEGLHPDLARDVRNEADENNEGIWATGWRFPDESLHYAAHVYPANAYAYVNYRPKLDRWGNESCRKTFQWIIEQWPPSGVSPGYGAMHIPSYIAPHPDIMACGAHIFKDIDPVLAGQCKFVANRMIREVNRRWPVTFSFNWANASLPEYKNSLFQENGWGLSLWDDSIIPVSPKAGSVYIKSPYNWPWEQYLDRPDKMIFREGWEVDSLYAMVSLRGKDLGHYLKGANAIFMITYGVPFVVINGENEEAARENLNCLLTGNSPDETSTVGYFETLPRVDMGECSISGHTRSCLLVKDKFFVVFDQGAGALRWHLKGEDTWEGKKVSLTCIPHFQKRFCAIGPTRLFER